MFLSVLINHINIIELLAVLASAITGILEARKKKMDIVGVFFVGMVTALGGGTVRDVLIDRHPVFWMQNELFPLSIFVLSLLSIAVIKGSSWNRSAVRWTILILDAMALALFSVVGAQYAIEKECSIAVSVIMGVVTGTFGGVIRDIICNEIPGVFRASQQLYATCSFTGTAAYVLLRAGGGNESVAAGLGIGATFIIRILAMIYNLRLPKKLA
jgi:uncharacterized membrane protein YeiH